MTTPLHNAALGNAREAADLLIARGADVNAKRKYGWTPLHHATWKNAREATGLLIARGADVNAKRQVWLDTVGTLRHRRNARDVGGHY